VKRESQQIERRDVRKQGSPRLAWEPITLTRVGSLAATLHNMMGTVPDSGGPGVNDFQFSTP
jgi:hypothetical protein